MTYEIKRGVPIVLGNKRRSYPWKSMEVGDMFEVEATEIRRVRSAACGMTAASGWKVKFTTQKLENGKYGVWRTE